MGRWVCDTCGATGHVPAEDDPDTLLCPICGEPVLAD
jgi:rubrerythrin